MKKDMQVTDQENTVRDFIDFIGTPSYPCVAARAALKRRHIPCLVAGHMGCPVDDNRMLNFIYGFIAEFRNSPKTFHSAAVIFQQPENTTEEMFDTLLWQRLQSLNRLDSRKYPYDHRVSANPSSPDFSYSLGGEAFFIIGLHPGSSRRARRFRRPAMIFNPHVQFQELRKSEKYEKMKSVVRSRDIAYSGSVNPMLKDFGKAPETFQYSGMVYEKNWKCPLKVIHEQSENHSSKK